MENNNFREPNATSLTLLERLRKDDSAAWEKLVALYNPLVVYWLNGFDIDSPTVEDMTQEIWHTVSQHIGDFRKTDAGGSFRGWLWTITRNKVRDLNRKLKQQPIALGGTEGRLLFDAIPEEEPILEEDLAGKEVVRRALQLVQQDFSEQTWAAFAKMVFDGQDALSVAKELQIKANAVHQARFRVLRRLREVLDGLLEF